MALCADAIIGNVQEKALKEHSSSNVEMVLYSYAVGFLYILAGLLVTGSLIPAFLYCLEVCMLANILPTSPPFLPPLPPPPLPQPFPLIPLWVIETKFERGGEVQGVQYLVWKYSISCEQQTHWATELLKRRTAGYDSMSVFYRKSLNYIYRYNYIQKSFGCMFRSLFTFRGSKCSISIVKSVGAMQVNCLLWKSCLLSGGSVIRFRTIYI